MKLWKYLLKSLTLKVNDRHLLWFSRNQVLNTLPIFKYEHFNEAWNDTCNIELLGIKCVVFY